MTYYDPGDDMYEESSRRRRRKRRRENPEYDDAWGAAFDEASFDEGIDPGAMAAGAIYEDRERYARGYEDDDDEREMGALPRPPLRRRAHRDLSRAERIRRRYDRTHAYSQSPSFQRSQKGVVGRLADRVTGSSDYPDKPKRGHSGNLLADLPFWGVAMLVFLGMAAILAVALTCIAALVLLG